MIFALLLQVVGAAAVHCIKSGIATSGEVGRSLHAYGQPERFGLQPGYLFGRDMVGGSWCTIPGLPAHSVACHLNLAWTSAGPTCLQDLSDIQWRGFRQGLPLMVLLFGAFAAVSNLASRLKLDLAGSMGFNSRQHSCPLPSC